VILFALVGVLAWVVAALAVVVVFAVAVHRRDAQAETWPEWWRPMGPPASNVTVVEADEVDP